MSESSVQVPKLVAALAKAQSQIAGAKKDSNNPHFNSKYADLASVWDACREALTANELAVIQHPSSEFVDNGVIVTVETILAHSSGEQTSSRLSMRPMRPDPQGIGSVLTYLRRYALASIVGIAPEDDDGNAASAPTGAERTTAPAKLPPPPPKATPRPQVLGDTIIGDLSTGFINKATQQKFHMRFRDAWVAAGGAAKMSELGLSAFLGANGYLSDDGKATTSRIPMDKIVAVWALAEDYIKANVTEAPGMDDEEAAQ